MVQYEGQQPLSLATPGKICAFLKKYLAEKKVIRKGDPLPLKRTIAVYLICFVYFHRGKPEKTVRMSMCARAWLSAHARPHVYLFNARA